MDPNKQPTAPGDNGVRALAGRAAWLTFFGPLQRNSLAVQRAWYQLTRVLFLLQCRLTAALSHASIDVHVDGTARVGLGVRMELSRSSHNALVIGPRCRVAAGAQFSLRNGNVHVGANTVVRRMATFQVSGTAEIGDEVLVSTGVVVHCEQSVVVGNQSVLSEYTTVADSRHVRTPPGVPIHHSTTSDAVRIGANVWVASHVVITSGVTIGDQAIIGGGAVVTNDVPDWWLAVGNPARLVKELTVEDAAALRTGAVTNI
jgi:acetyltransferase-like isoleucine patch superfamily enzyme